MQLWLQPIGGYLVWALLAVALLALLRVRAVGVTERRRRVLTGLRLAAVIVALLVMLRPTIVHTQVKKQSASLLVLLDRSRSMQVGDGFGDKSRWDTLRQVLGDAAPQLASLAGDLDVKFYAFDTDVAPVGRERRRSGHSRANGGVAAVLEQLPEAPEGEQSAIGARSTTCSAPNRTNASRPSCSAATACNGPTRPVTWHRKPPPGDWPIGATPSTRSPSARRAA
ncbi:MAG: hypothetical protein R3C10_01125 [Pirellulales bacterium]